VQNATLWRALLGVEKTVVENIEFDEDEAVQASHPRHSGPTPALSMAYHAASHALRTTTENSADDGQLRPRRRRHGGDHLRTLADDAAALYLRADHEPGHVGEVEHRIEDASNLMDMGRSRPGRRTTLAFRWPVRARSEPLT